MNGSVRHIVSELREEAEQLFPAVLVECIRDARPPDEKEVGMVCKKLWSEGLAYSQSGYHGRAEAMARAALCGVSALHPGDPAAIMRQGDSDET